MSVSPTTSGATKAPVTTLSMPYKSIRTIFNPMLDRRGVKVSEAIVPVLDIPAGLAKWRDINPRDPRVTGAVAQRIVRGMIEDTPEIFSLKNRGLCIVCKERKIVQTVTTATKAGVINRLDIKLENPKLHGLIDGGSTYELARQNSDAIAALDFEQLIKIEIIEGLTADNEDLIVSIVEARNTSNAVRDKTLYNAKGYFDPIRDALGPQWSRYVAYSEYEIGDGGADDCSVLVEDIIAMMVCMDIEYFDRKMHPVMAYGSKKRLLEYYAHAKDTSLKPLFPLLKDLIGLWEDLYWKFPAIYNKTKNGYFASLPGVKKLCNNTKPHKLPFTQRESQYGIPLALCLPVFAVFRLLLRKNGDGSYYWHKDPRKMLTQDFGKRIIEEIGDLDKKANNVNGMAKDAANWRILYLEAERLV